MSINSLPSMDELKWTVQGTCLYLFVYSIALPFQAFSKFYLLNQKKLQEKKTDDAKSKVDFRAIKYYNHHDTLALIGDRWVGQFVEFSILFLPLLWFHAIFVDHTQSLPICAIYSFSKALFPFVFSRNAYPGVLISAFPGYAVLGYLQLRLLWYYLLA